MANIYPLDAERNLFLYHSGSNIYLGTSNGRAFTRAVILTNDYAGDLSDVVYNGTIYFSYQNSNHDIILQNITDTEPVFRISQQDIPDCFSPKLIVFLDTLLLLYFIKNPLNDTYLLKGVFPEQKERKLRLSSVFQDKPVIHPLVTYNRLLLCIIAGEHMDFLMINKNWEITQLSLQDERFQKESQKFTTQIKYLQKELAQRDAMIESAKRQYTELMDTATKYRDEAIKWRSKFI